MNNVRSTYNFIVEVFLSLYFIYLFRFVWMIEHFPLVCDMHPYIMFIIFVRPCHLFRSCLLWLFCHLAVMFSYVYFGTFHAITIVVDCRGACLFVRYFYTIFVHMRMCVFHYRSYFDHLCPVFQR